MAFRWMHNAATNSNFEPPAIAHGRSADACESFALSFYKDLASARAAYKKLYDRLHKKINFVARYGDHVGELKLVEGDGLMGAPAKTGHFDLHQEEAVEFHDRIISYSVARV